MTLLNKKVFILGLGWLGLPLAQRLKSSYLVSGTKTSPSKDIQDISFQVFDFSMAPEKLSLDPEATLIVNTPPKALPTSGPWKKFFFDAPSRFKQLIFFSSTGVFGLDQGPVSEETPPLPTSSNGKILLSWEKEIQRLSLPWVILRPAGLVGTDRHPVYSLAGKTQLKDGKVNLVHVYDVIKAVELILEQGPLWNQIYHLCAPLHPPKSQYYSKLAQMRSLPAPTYLQDQSNKEILADKLWKMSGSPMTFPDPYQF